MKKILIGLTLLTSMASFAAEDCNVKGVATVFTIDRDIFLEENVGVNYRKKVSTWEDCYHYAIERSKIHSADSNGTVTAHPSRVSKNAKFYLSFDWEFQDGFVWLLNTSGKITTFTDQYEKIPYEGDMRYFHDGRVFK